MTKERKRGKERKDGVPLVESQGGDGCGWFLGGQRGRGLAKSFLTSLNCYVRGILGNLLINSLMFITNGKMGKFFN